MDLTKIFNDEIYTKPPTKNYETNKILYDHFDEIWSFDMADMIDYKSSSNRVFRYIFEKIDKFGKNLWTMPLKNKYSQTITNEFSKILFLSKRHPLKIVSVREAEFYFKIFQNFLISKTFSLIQEFQIKVLVELKESLKL